MEDDTLIPCEVCDVYIPFSQYQEHSRSCYPFSQPQIFPFALPLVSFPIPNANSNSNQDENQNQDEDENENQDDNEEGFDNMDQQSFTNFMNLVNNPVSNLDQIRNAFNDLVRNGGQGFLNNNFGSGNQFQDFLDLEDVEVPTKDIDKVAPLVKTGEEIPDDLDCVICQDIVSQDARKTLCKHYFCSACLEKWLGTSKRCPTCNLDLEDFLEKNDKDKDKIKVGSEK